MKTTVFLIIIAVLFVAGCTTTPHQHSTYVQPSWDTIKGMTKSEIAAYLYTQGDETMIQIHTYKQLLLERRALLAAKQGAEAADEVKRIDSILSASDEQAVREAETRYNYALNTATEKK